MTESSPKEISQAEWKVMKVLWRLESVAARDVCQETEAHYDMTDATTRTLLRRLAEKGHIKTRQIGNSYLYEPVSSMMNTICEAADQLLDNTPKETASSLMQHMVRSGKLSGKDIEELRSLLDEHKGKKK